MTASTTKPRPSEKLKDCPYLIPCTIRQGAFSQLRLVSFPAYDSQGRLGVESTECPPNYIDQAGPMRPYDGLCRVELLKKDEVNKKALIYIHGFNFHVHLDSLVQNSTQNP